MNNTDDNRTLPRIEVDCPMTFHDIDSPNIKEGIALNVSNGGILFVANEKMADGAIKEVHIRPPAGVAPPLDAVIQIVRVDEDEVAGRYQIGGIIKVIK